VPIEDFLPKRGITTLQTLEKADLFLGIKNDDIGKTAPDITYCYSAIVIKRLYDCAKINDSELRFGLIANYGRLYTVFEAVKTEIQEKNASFKSIHKSFFNQ